MDNSAVFKSVLNSKGKVFRKLSVDQLVRVQQLMVLYKQGLLAYLGTAAASAVVITLLWDDVPRSLLIFWGGAVFISISLAFTWSIFFKRLHIFPRHINHLDKTFSLQAFIHGSVWGSLGLLVLYTNNDQILMGVIITLVGMATGSITTTAAVYRSFLAYMLPTMLPMSISLVVYKDVQQWNLVGGLLILYTIVIAVAGFEFHRSLRDSFQLRNQNADLVDTLVAEKTKTEGMVKILEKEIIEREKAEDQILHAMQAAEDANSAKSRFLANMSHEIRTPLASIIGFSELLLEEEDHDERIRSTNTIINNGKHLLEVINDILDLSKIESDKLEVEHIDVPIIAMLYEIESTFSRLVREKNITFSLDFEYPVPELIHSDSTRIRQIIFNLISNAIKFTEKGNIGVLVSFDGAKHLLTIAVTDSGIGMNDEQLSRLFQPFSQADISTTREYGGTGLGLTISRRLSRMLGGDLVCKSEAGKGSTFTLTVDTGEINGNELVYASLRDEIQTTKSSDAIPSLSGRILVAEDSPDIQRLVEMMLKRCGVEYEIVGNGKLAVEKALATDFDLILTDMQMPVMDGIEAATLLRSLNVETPIVAMTANLLAEEKQQYDAAGMNGYIGKPINQESFYATISRFLSEEESYSLQHLEVDEEYQQLVEKFKERTKMMMKEMGEYVAANDMKNLAGVSHTLKGLGGSFGFPEVTELSGSLEQAARDSDQAMSEDVFSRLNAFVQANVI